MHTRVLNEAEFRVVLDKLSAYCNRGRIDRQSGQYRPLSDLEYPEILAYGNVIVRYSQETADHYTMASPGWTITYAIEYSDRHEWVATVLIHDTDDRFDKEFLLMTMTNDEGQARVFRN